MTTTIDAETGHRAANKPHPPRPLTDRQRAMLAFIIRYKAETQGHSPTIREMQRAAGITSTSLVSYNLERLARRGCIEIVLEGTGRALDIRIPGARWIAPDETEEAS